LLERGASPANRYFRIYALTRTAAGEGIEFDLSTTAFMLAAVFAVVVTAPSHEALVATVAPVTGDAARAARRSAAQATQRGSPWSPRKGLRPGGGDQQAIDDAVGCTATGGRLETSSSHGCGELPAVSAVGQVLDGVRGGRARRGSSCGVM